MHTFLSIGVHVLSGARTHGPPGVVTDRVGSGTTDVNRLLAANPNWEMPNLNLVHSRAPQTVSSHNLKPAQFNKNRPKL